MKFRKKPVVIEAIQFTGFNNAELFEFRQRIAKERGVAHGDLHHGFGPERFWVRTLEGDMDITPGDWLICGVQGEFYPCKPDIFAATYEPAEDV